MSDQIIRLYVTAPDGRYLPGIGPRAYGAYFELPEDVALSLSHTPGFSTEPVTPPETESPVPVKTKKKEG